MKPSEQDALWLDVHWVKAYFETGFWSQTGDDRGHKMLRFLLQNWYRYPDAFVLVVGRGRRGVGVSNSYKGSYFPSYNYLGKDGRLAIWLHSTRVGNRKTFTRAFP
jgi:hypothetical protein